MRIVYLGTPDFAVLPLKRIVQEGYEVVGVITQLDKPVGRKQIMTPPPVKQIANELGLQVFQYEKIRLEGVEDIKRLNPDIMVTCAYGQILSQEIIDIPKHGIINIHASLLPKLRGSSPIQWSIINGEKKTGVTIMRTDIGVDTGDILLQKELLIDENETAGELFDRLSLLGADAIIDALKMLENGNANFIPQNHNDATHTKMIKKELGNIDFNKTAKDVHNLVRGLNPWPIAYFSYNNEVIKVYKTEIITFNHDKKAGTILNADTKNGLIIACKENAIKILELQRSGGKRINIIDFLRGFKFEEGTVIND